MAVRTGLCLLVACALGGGPAGQNAYLWQNHYSEADGIAARIPPPAGYRRADSPAGSFADWLRHLPLKPGRPPVRLYNGELKANQEAHFAVMDIDVGAKDLQQCADAVVRLRAEYLFSARQFDAIHFNFTSGDRADFTKWASGYRPAVKGNRVEWRQSERAGSSYAAFRDYLNTVFAYAGTASLRKELSAVREVRELDIGDVFIKGGAPGHAVIVVDLAVNEKSGAKAFLLAQSYMPAQDVHVLRNPAKEAADPWYGADFGETLRTPEWTFARGDLRRFAAGVEARGASAEGK